MLASILAHIGLILHCVAAAAHNYESLARNVFPAITRGCGKQLPEGQVLSSVNEMSILIGSQHRHFLVFVPPHYAKQTPTPLILSFHGGNETAYDQLRLDNLTSPDFNKGSFVVYPQGLNKTWEGVPNVHTNDTLFTSELLNKLESLYCIDSSRIWATGKSDGGGFCGVLACDVELSTRIAAFAPVSGAFYVRTLPCNSTGVTVPCHTLRTKVPFLEFHGGHDGTISYTGGKRHHACLPSIPNYMQQWAARDDLSPDNCTTKLQPDTFVYRWGKGSEFGLVTHIFDATIGHDWPATFLNHDNKRANHVVASFNATPIILDFFDSHPMVQNVRKEL